MKKNSRIGLLIAGLTILQINKKGLSNNNKNIRLDPLKAAFLYIGPTGDHGWTFAHDQGAKYVKEMMGG